MRSYPLATLVFSAADTMDANHLPLQFSQHAGTAGRLSGHVARANPLCAADMDGKQVLVIFHGPQAYISPAWYATKARTGKVVPTWNYVVVHAHGTLKLIDDADWLRTHLASLTAEHEAGFATPWQLTDAPTAFIDQLLQAVVGIEIEITRLSGKCKASQNQPLENQRGVIQGLSELDQQPAQTMAATIVRCNQL